MDASVLGLAGAAACLGLSATGSAFGAGFASMSSVGAWKKCYLQDKPAPFALMIFVGAPMTQTLYGYILFRQIMALSEKMVSVGAATFNTFAAQPFYYLLFAGLTAGLGIGVSAVYQGKVAAACADAYTEAGGKGMGYYLMVVGVLETVALLVMVFMLITLGNLVK